LASPVCRPLAHTLHGGFVPDDAAVISGLGDQLAAGNRARRTIIDATGGRAMLLRLPLTRGSDGVCRAIGAVDRSLPGPMPGGQARVYVNASLLGDNSRLRIGLLDRTFRPIPGYGSDDAEAIGRYNVEVARLTLGITGATEGQALTVKGAGDLYLNAQLAAVQRGTLKEKTWLETKRNLKRFVKAVGASAGVGTSSTR
jgi:hypothetical protein